jgi:hypothetical protein
VNPFSLHGQLVSVDSGANYTQSIHKQQIYYSYYSNEPPLSIMVRLLFEKDKSTE